VVVWRGADVPVRARMRRYSDAVSVIEAWLDGSD
jgi:hypothetical protein